MKINNRRDANHWASAWEWKPRRGVLAEAIAGLKWAYGISCAQNHKSRENRLKDLGEALEVLENLQKKLYPEQK